MIAQETPFARRDSGVHGQGVYATRDIRAGEAVMEFGGIVVEAHEVTPAMRVMQVDEGLYFAEDTSADHDENYVNHSCRPNLGFVDGSPVLRALRDIRAGEELFWDYSTSMNEPGWRLECRCGVPGCRGVIQSFCDLHEEDRRRLGPIALAYLRR